MKSRPVNVDWGKIKDEIKEMYQVEVKNRYTVLRNEGMEQYRRETPNEKLEDKWESLKASIKHGCEQLPKKQKTTNKPWMTDEILDLMTEGKKAKNTPRYKDLDKKIQRKCKKARENWISDKCRDIEESNKKNQTREMHSDIKELTGRKKKNNTTGGIKSKNGKMLFEKEDILKRWTEYVGELFEDTRPNLPTPSNNNGPKILKAEVECAIKISKRQIARRGRHNNRDGQNPRRIRY